MKDLNRFVRAQEKDYETALKEIKKLQKRNSLDMVYISSTKRTWNQWYREYYGIENKEEAIAYLNHKTLRSHLLEFSKCL